MGGMNGGMDFLCGSLIVYDEMTRDFGSNDSDRLEYLKSITMEQHVHNIRTIKVRHLFFTTPAKPPRQNPTRTTLAPKPPKVHTSVPLS